MKIFFATSLFETGAPKPVAVNTQSVFSVHCHFLSCFHNLYLSDFRNKDSISPSVQLFKELFCEMFSHDLIDTEIVMAFLHRLRKIYLDKPVKTVSDNVQHQHCKAVMGWQSVCIELLFLLVYFPNLNIIERLWRFTEKEICYGQYYDSAQKFLEVIRTFFAEVDTNIPCIWKPC
jgi:hypothetical protein